MQCEEVRSYFAEELLPLAIQEHLGGCVACREELQALRETWEDLKVLSNPQIPHDPMLRRLVETVVTGIPVTASKHSRVPQRVLLAMVALVVLAVAVFAAQRGLFLVLKPQPQLGTHQPTVMVSSSIEGTVYLYGSQRPAVGIEVALLESGNARGTMKTDASGHFAFTNISEGEYEVHAFGDRKFGVPRGGPTLPEFSSTSIRVGTHEQAKTALSLVDAGTISGRITFSDGTASAKLMVQPYHLTFRNGVRSRLAEKLVTYTAADGTFRLVGLQPGVYLVGVGEPPAAGDDAAYYPGTYDKDLAKIVDVRMGRTTILNWTIPERRWASISGKVVYRSSLIPKLPLNALNLWPPARFRSLGGLVFGTVGSVGSGTPNSATDNGIDYLIENVSTGMHFLSFPDFGLTTSLGQPEPNLPCILRLQNEAVVVCDLLNVQSKDILDSEIQVWPANTHGHLDGRIVVLGNPESVALNQLEIGLVGFDGRPVDPIGDLLIDRSTPRLEPPGGAVAGEFRISNVIGLSYSNNFEQVFKALGFVNEGRKPTVTAAVRDGQFRLEDLVGKQLSVRITRGLPASAYIADVRMSGKSVAESGFSADFGSSDPLEITIDTRGGTITGVVETPNHSLAKTGIVALVPAPSHRGNIYLFKSTTISEVGQPGTLGKFKLSGIAPGQYKLFAWEFVPPDAWTDTDFMKKYEARGVPVSITQGSSVNTHVQLIPME